MIIQTIREKFHISIRKKKIQEFFKENRNRINLQSEYQPEFPKQEFQDIIDNINVEESLNRISQFLIHEHSEQATVQMMGDILKWLPYLIQQIEDFPIQVSLCLVNLTYLMNHEEMRQFFDIVPFSQLLLLLRFAKNNQVTESFSQLLINFINELSIQEFKDINYQFNLIEIILSTLEHHGTSILGYTNFSRIINHIVLEKAQVIDYEQIAIYADNMLQDQFDHSLRSAAIKLLHRLLFQLDDKEEMMVIVSNLKSLKHIVNQMLDQTTSFDEIVYSLKLVLLLCQTNNILLNYVLNQFNLVGILIKLVETQQFINETKLQNIVNKIMIEIYDQDIVDKGDQYQELVEQFITSVKRILKECQDLRKQIKAPPPNLVFVFQVMHQTNYWDLFIVNCPLIEVINLLMSQEESKCEYQMYLILMRDIITQGEGIIFIKQEIYPNEFVGKFLKYNGEAILEEIQMKGTDLEYKMAQEFQNDLLYND